MILLMIFDNGISAEGDLTNEDEERLVTFHWLIKLNWSNGPFWIYGDCQNSPLVLEWPSFKPVMFVSLSVPGLCWAIVLSVWW